MNRFGILIFTDIILGAVAILIVIIVINRPKHQTITHIPQADFALTCLKTIDNQPYVEINEKTSNPVAFSRFLTSLQALPKTSVRLLVKQNIEPTTGDDCIKLLISTVSELNKAYEKDRKAIAHPYMFLSQVLTPVRDGSSGE